MSLQFTILTKSEDGPCLYWCTGAGESLQAVADTLRLEKRSHTLIACQSADWDRDYSPWPAPPVFDKQGFAGQGEQTLAQIRAFFTQDGAAERPRAIGGYSLAGLFSLWSAAQVDDFAAVAAVSPSVWFPGWRAYADQHALRSRVVYLSLGDREEKSRNPVLASVGDAIRREDARLSERGVRHTLQWNVGNHFQDAEKRCADGFAWCMAQRKAEGKNT